MPFALFMNDQQISGPFQQKSEAWADAAKRGLVEVIPSRDEDPPHRFLKLNCRIAPVADRTFQQQTNRIAVCSMLGA